MSITPDEDPEERRRRLLAQRLARQERQLANQELAFDRTAFLSRQFGLRATGNPGPQPGSLRLRSNRARRLGVLPNLARVQG